MEISFGASPLIIPAKVRSYLLGFLLWAAAAAFQPIGAQSIWTGAVDNSWATAGNWSSGTPSTISGAPSNVTFSTNDANGDTLTLDGTYYLNRMVVEALNYGTNEKNLASPGLAGSKLVFQSIGTTMPTIQLNMLQNNAVASGALTRDIAIRADIEIADDLTLTRTGQGTLSPEARLYRSIFYGVISGSGKLIINSSSTSNSGRIWFDNHNTFTGDIEMQTGYLYQNFADSLGSANKTLTFGALGNVTWDLTSSNINVANGTTLPYDLVLPATTSRNVLINAGGVGRQLTFTGDITGSASHSLSQRALWLIAQSNQQFVFAGENMTFGGQVFARYGTEIAIASANASGVAWQNVRNILLGQEITTSVTGTTNNSSFVLRGDYTLNAPFQIAKRSVGSTGRDISSIGQINHQGVAFQSLFNGGIEVLESDYRALNLISEGGGQATFTGAVRIPGTQGLLINEIANTTTSGGTLNYYEAAPTGTVTFSSTSRLGQALSGVVSAGVAQVIRGTLLVNTPNFYAGVEVLSAARLGGTGRVTGNVTILNGGVLEPGAGQTSPSFSSAIGSLTIDGDLSLTGAQSLILQVNGASFNVGDTPVGDIPTLYASSLTNLGDHDYLNVTGVLAANSLGSIRFSPSDTHQLLWGDVYHLLDFTSMTTGALALDGVLDLPNVGSIDPNWAWNTDLFLSHGLLVLTPEPSRMGLILIALLGGVLRRRR